MGSSSSSEDYVFFTPPANIPARSDSDAITDLDLEAIDVKNMPFTYAPTTNMISDHFFRSSLNSRETVSLASSGKPCLLWKCNLHQIPVGGQCRADYKRSKQRLVVG